jgi:hypothetical protein
MLEWDWILKRITGRKMFSEKKIFVKAQKAHIEHSKTSWKQS